MTAVPVIAGSLESWAMYRNCGTGVCLWMIGLIHQLEYQKQRKNKLSD